jgi:hypothetical protein
MLAITTDRMSLLSRPRRAVRRSVPRQEARVPGPAVWALLGGGLALFGLLRRRQAGLALALMGGYLVYRNLRRSSGGGRRTGESPRPPTASDREELRGFAAESFALGEAACATLAEAAEVRAEESSAEALELAASLLAAQSLTPAEHHEAEVRAYFSALERGGGWLPPYDPWWAREDFCRAAGEVMRRRGQVLI